MTDHSQQPLHEVYLALGSNLGDRHANLLAAIRMIDERVGHVQRQSSFLETEPWGFQSEHRFVNAAVLCLTSFTPQEVLTLTQDIERALGRTAKTTDAYTDRPIDIDILLYDDWQVNEPGLVIPHPLMHERDFVMIPLREIKP